MSPPEAPHTSARDASSRFLWPPTIYGLSCLVAWGLHKLTPLPFMPASLNWLALAMGGLLLVCAALLGLAAEWGLFRAGTATLPISPTTAVVTTGIFARTRNPIYLGMSTGLAGIGFVLNDFWFLLAVPLAMFAVVKLAIEPEEFYLARKFGQPYLDYCRGVRRWL